MNAAGESQRRPWPLPVLGLVFGVIVLVATMLAIFVVALITGTGTTDFAVYRGAVEYWLSGGDLYDFALVAPAGGAMPFTYPPFAAIVMVPATWVPLSVGLAVSAVVQLGCLLGLAIVVAKRTGVLSGRVRPEQVAILALGWLALAISEPALHGIATGQISLVLIAVVAVDVVIVPPRWRGLLTGLAAALKLTPALFVIYFLVTRQWRAAANAALSGLVATAIGFAVLPGQSWRYWTSLIFDTSRVGDPEVVRNKSFLGLLSHLGLSGPGRTTLWLAVSLLVVVIGLWQARRSYTGNAALAAAITVGFVATVISPISWPHHLVWLPLAGLYLTSCVGWRRVAGVVLLIAFLGWTPLISYQDGLAAAWAVAGDVVSVVLLVGAVVGVPARPGGELAWPGVSRRSEPSSVGL